jgi:hypothetical protein
MKLYQQGWTEEKIADEVRSDLAVIREWLSRAKAKPTTIRRNERRSR